MHFLRIEIIFLISLNFVINLGNSFGNINILELLPESQKFWLQPTHQLIKSILHSLLIFQHSISINSLSKMKLFNKFFIWNNFTCLFFMSATSIAHEGIAYSAYYWDADLSAFVFVFLTFWVVVHSIIWF